MDGSGLGLAIVQEIAQRHQAAITVEDARARTGATAALPGTVFTLRFPCGGLPEIEPQATAPEVLSSSFSSEGNA